MTDAILAVVCSGAAIGSWASLWGRDRWSWGLAGAASPITASVALLIRGRGVRKVSTEN